MTQKRPLSQDDVVTAVLSGAPTVRRLVKRFTEEIGDPLDDEGITFRRLTLEGSLGSTS